jgi:signal transduction histidine kinase/DNA-binding response OmpR family regulator
VLRVLVVEDNDADADLVGEALGEGTTGDIHVRRVSLLKAAVTSLHEERFDVVLLDLSLPDAMGLEGVHRVRAEAPCMPLVVLTSMLDPAAGTRALAHGAQDFLIKGELGASELLRAIRYARERQQYADRTRLLADVGEALSGSLDPKMMLASLVAAVSPGFADRCVVDGLSEMGWLTGADVIAAPKPGTSRLYVSLAEGQDKLADRGRLDALGDPAISSGMVIPFLVNGVEGGALVVGRLAASPPLGAADLALGEEIARRTVSALEHLCLASARRDRESADLASRLKDEFLATLSHELRTPLTSILGWTRMLRGGKLPAEKHERGLAAIERGALSQVALIEEVLDVSRIVTGKFRLALGKLVIARAVDAALETVRPMADAKGVLLHASRDEETGTIDADSERFQQVLWNLLSNAVKFTPRGGNVRVHVARDESLLEIAVHDDGQGIVPEFLPHVFERFRQADSSATRTHTGLGLGLAIARHIVEQHGGRIRVESAGTGKGTTFVVRIPVNAAGPSSMTDADAARAIERASQSPAPSTSLKGCRILLVEDDLDTLAFLEMVLQEGGAIVSTGSSASEALRAIHAAPPDLLISDIGLPGDDGCELIRSVRRLSAAEGGQVLSVAMSAYTRKEDRARALAAGFNHYLDKPFELAEFLTLMEKMSAGLARA